jgi:cytochrome P450
MKASPIEANASFWNCKLTKDHLLALRLISPAGHTTRECLEDCLLPQSDDKPPFFVTRGTRIDIDWHVMQRDPLIWGADANDFLPERWEVLRPQWDYIPFLGGPRICPAQQMILTQYAYIIVRFVQTFEKMENRDSVLEFIEEHKMSKKSKNGVKVALTR